MKEEKIKKKDIDIYKVKIIQLYINSKAKRGVVKRGGVIVKRGGYLYIKRDLLLYKTGFIII